MADYIDQMGRKISFSGIPKRIISLVPSQSELLYDLGLDKRLVGITKFCIHPKQMHQHITHIGGTKKLNIEKIIDLNPDLIIGNKEENEQIQIETLAEQFPVWMSDINNLADALNMIRAVAELCDEKGKGLELVQKIKSAFDKLNPLSSPLSCAYLIWRKPYMAAGHNTFINDMLKRSGFENVFLPTDGRYPESTAEQLQQLTPKVILLSSEPFPFAEKHILELQHLLPASYIILVDGELFSWYGSRLLHTTDYLNQLIEKCDKKM